MKRLSTNQIILHHSWTEDNVLLNDTEAIRRYHMQNNGWNDIGYHLVLEQIDNNWVWKDGRPIDDVGAHCKENRRNYTSIGICVVGNFDKYELPLQAQGMLFSKIIELNDQYGKQLTVEPHKQHALYKTCPGKMFDYADILVALEQHYSERYTDVSKTDYGYDAIETISELGLMNGISETEFAPDKPITRRDFAVVLERLVDILDLYR